MTKKLLGVVAALTLIMSASVARAALMYTWSGEVPADTGAGSYVLTLSGISVGDTWTVTAVIDETVANTGTGNTGQYVDAALNVTLSFSSGFSKNLGTGDILVYDGDSLDGISVRFTTLDSLVAQTSTDVLNTLTSTDLVAAGTAFASSPSVTADLYYNLQYSSASGSVVYYGNTANNSEFEAQNVPEPATLALFGLGLAGLGAVRRKKLAA